MKVCLQDTPVILIQKADNSKHGRKNMYVLNVSHGGVVYPIVLYKKVLQLGVGTPLVSIH